LAITKPGYSIKHGTLVDQHLLQRDAYDELFAKGYRSARTAITAKGKTVRDVYHTAWRHEQTAKATFGIESSQHEVWRRAPRWRHGSTSRVRSSPLHRDHSLAAIRA
jgi:hypothetical protein